MKEEFRIIPGFDEFEVSNFGRVRRSREGYNRRPKGAFKSTRIDKDGYVTCTIKGSSRGIHRLVALAFHGAPPTPKHQAAHWDGNKLNNHPMNIRWATNKENSEDQIRHGKVRRGEKNHAAKFSEQDILFIIQSIAEGETASRMALRFNTSITAIGYIVSGQNWGHVVSPFRQQAKEMLSKNKARTQKAIYRK